MENVLPFGLRFVSKEPLPDVTPRYDVAYGYIGDSELSAIFADDNTLTFTPGKDNMFDD